MNRFSAAGTTIVVIVTALVAVAVAIRLADAALVGLPGGAELVAWSFGVAAVVAALMVAAWARRGRIDQSFGIAVVRGLAPFAFAGLFTVVVWYLLFYGSGHYEKGGYERLASAFALLVAAIIVAVVAAARFVARATIHDAARVAKVVAVTMLAFVGTFALPMLL